MMAFHEACYDYDPSRQEHAEIESITLPEQCALTEDGVEILLSADYYSDFGETPDINVTIPRAAVSRYLRLK